MDYWLTSGNKAIQTKIAALVESIKLMPFEEIGKPEQLRHELSGKWSRRITQEHRLVYEVENDKIFIYSM